MTRPGLPIHRLDSGSAFVVEGRPLVCAGDDIEALPRYRLSVRQGRIESVERAAPLSGGPVDGETFLMPGLADPHVHLVGMASARLHAVGSVAGVGSLDDFLARVADLAATRTTDWVRLEGFEEADLAEGEIPSLAALDHACPDRPLRVRHASRHGSLLNSCGRQWLQRRGWSAGFDDGAMIIGREMELARYLPRIEASALQASLRDVGEFLLQCGVTSVDDVTPSNDGERLALLEAVDLPQSVRFWLGVDADWGLSANAASRVSIAGVKLLPQDERDVRAGWFREAVWTARRQGLPLAIHAVEPDAIAATLEVLAEAPPRAPGGPRGMDRIEHASLCPPALVEALAASGLAVVTQPAFLGCRGARYRRQLERPLWGWLYPVASLARAGVPVAFSSDAPVAPPGLAATLAAASGRGRGGLADFGASERVSPGFVLGAQVEAPRTIQGRPAGGAWFSPGEEANFLVLSQDPRPSGFADLQVAAVALPRVGGVR